MHKTSVHYSRPLTHFFVQINCIIHKHTVPGLVVPGHARVPHSEIYIVDTSVLGTFSNEPGEAGGSLS